MSNKPDNPSKDPGGKWSSVLMTQAAPLVVGDLHVPDVPDTAGIISGMLEQLATHGMICSDADAISIDYRGFSYAELPRSWYEFHRCQPAGDVVFFEEFGDYKFDHKREKWVRQPRDQQQDPSTPETVLIRYTDPVTGEDRQLDGTLAGSQVSLRARLKAKSKAKWGSNGTPDKRTAP